MSETEAEQSEASVVIRVPVEEVWAVVSDPRNDLKWCSRLVSVDQKKGRAPAVGARYLVVERPSFYRRLDKSVEIITLAAPERFASRQIGELAEITTTYVLEAAEKGTRLTQRDETIWKTSRLNRAVAKRMRTLAVTQQLAELKRLLEEA